MWQHDIAIFFGALFFANAVPHTVAGVLGRPFQTPFAKPGGEGYSSSRVNVLWGFFNLVVAYALLVRVGDFDVKNLEQAGCAFVGAFVISLFAGTHFARFNGGSDPVGEQKKRDAGKAVA